MNLWFTPQNVEEGKCILEGTETYVNVKHQNERLLKRTPSLSTSNEDPWRHVQGERKAMENNVHVHNIKDHGRIERVGNHRTKPTHVVDHMERLHRGLHCQKICP